MIVLCCPECLSTKVERYEEGKRAEKHDWFKCTDCDKKFPLSRTSYRPEANIFE